LAFFRSISFFSSLASAALVLAATACSKGCNDHPYVPYAIESNDAAPPTEDAAPAASATDGAGGGPFAEKPAAVAPPSTTRWTVDGVTLEAPAGRVLVLVLARDFDGDGAKDAIAIVRAQDGSTPGELFYYRGKPGTEALEPPQTIAPPGEIALDASCQPVQRLALVGKRSVLAEVGATCPLHPTSAATRWIEVLLVDKSARVHFGATLRDPPGAPKLTVDADGADQDGDGIEDVALRVTVEGGQPPFEPGPRVSALLKWLDRPAGLSPEPGATDASLMSLASIAMARATRAKEAPAVPGYVAQVRALYRAICTEGGAARITRANGVAGVACGPSHALEEAGLASVRAFATTGEPLRAIAALERAQRPPATKTPARTAEAKGWIAQVAPDVTARGPLRAIAAVPSFARGHEPAWGALAFEPSGKLLVRTAAGVVRVDPDQGDEASADGVASWKSGVVSPDGAMRWIEAYDPCDGTALHATFAPTGDAEPRDVALPIAPGLSTRCAGSRGEPAHALAIAWGTRGLEAIVDGEPVLVASDFSRASSLAASLDQPSTPGAPRSPDGKTIAVPTSLGILVRGTKARLLRAPEIDGSYAEQRDCVVSDDATHVACIRAGKAWVGAWD
jgi:hypothetical protein